MNRVIIGFANANTAKGLGAAFDSKKCQIPAATAIAWFRSPKSGSITKPTASSSNTVQASLSVKCNFPYTQGIDRGSVKESATLRTCYRQRLPNQAIIFDLPCDFRPNPAEIADFQTNKKKIQINPPNITLRASLHAAFRRITCRSPWHDLPGTAASRYP